MQVKKEFNLQQFDIIHLLNSEFKSGTLRAKQNYVTPFHLLKITPGNPEIETKLFFMSFHLFSVERMRRGCAADTLYAGAEGRGAKLLLMPSCFAKLLEAIFHVLPKLDGCQAKIANCWSSSKAATGAPI
jgi:hypothetical protein